MNPNTRNFWITASLLVLTLTVANLGERRTADFLAAPLETIPTQIDGWRMSRAETLDQHVLQVLIPTSYVSRIYRKDGRRLEMFVAFYAVQRAGENMHSPKNCLPGSGWEIWRQDTLSLPVEGRTVQINKLSVQNTGQRNLILYWYQNKKRIIASEYLGKLLLVRDSLWDGHTSGAIARVMVPDTAQDSDGGAVFASHLIVELQRCFGR